MSHARNEPREGDRAAGYIPEKFSRSYVFHEKESVRIVTTVKKDVRALQVDEGNCNLSSRPTKVPESGGLQISFPPSPTTTNTICIKVNTPP